MRLLRTKAALKTKETHKQLLIKTSRKKDETLSKNYFNS